MMKLFGKNPVMERLRSNPQSIRKIFIQPGLPEAAYIYKKAKQHGDPGLRGPGREVREDQPDAQYPGRSGGRR